ncbi:polyprenyl synthetase family protein [Streptomyces sp. TX20-6-3]|uniref:polyprenyl synthetase family protein n=1 Tax=Streptomyces sp. TX20-6-3 TaxID=3028705 RepID=UPI0029A7AA69|nr:polyprenyl synthetase family protein [Streptomyces sp. TX20-6-3]MDX2565381.1 polyprenyl synthetase family protein [Streptomyces sp. TX20-6-3]
MVLTVPTSALVRPPAVLERSRSLVEPELRAAVSPLHPELARMAAYSFGWCEADGVAAESRGGKMLRSALALLSAELVGARAEKAVPGALGVELLHAFSLIHDDIMDADEQRRHRPTVWKAYGTGSAILAGDVLAAIAFRAVSQDRHAQEAGNAVKLLSQAMVDLCEGQAADISFERRPWLGSGQVTVAEYRAMAAGKTGALIACSLAIGAVLCGSSSVVVNTLLKTGHGLGLAFQITDDVLSGTGDPQATGKPVLNDLRAGKKTYPVLAALSAPGSASAQLRSLLAAQEAASADDPADQSDETLARIGALVAEAGGYEQAAQEARRLAHSSLTALENGHFHAGPIGELQDLAAFLLDRSA